MHAHLNEDAHAELVKATALTLELNGYEDVRAALEGYRAPGTIRWRRRTGDGQSPDVMGQRDGLEVFQIVTGDRLHERTTDERLALFSAFAKGHGARFTVVVPRGWRHRAWARLEERGIAAGIWEM
jgi:hypothetical protein